MTIRLLALSHAHSIPNPRRDDRAGAGADNQVKATVKGHPDPEKKKVRSARDLAVAYVKCSTGIQINAQCIITIQDFGSLCFALYAVLHAS